MQLICRLSTSSRDYQIMMHDCTRRPFFQPGSMLDQPTPIMGIHCCHDVAAGVDATSVFIAWVVYLR